MSDSQILGDSIKKSRFNKDLADVVNKDVESRLKREARENKKSKKVENIPENNIVENNTIMAPNIDGYLLDLQPVIAPDMTRNYGKGNNYNDWVDYWKTINDGRTMASLPDFYTAFRQIYANAYSEDSSRQARAHSFRDNLRLTLRSDHIIVNTAIHYEPIANEGCVIQDYSRVKDTNVDFGENYKGLLINYIGDPIEKILDVSANLEYLQTLLGTNDQAETIISILEFISERDRKKIHLHTLMDSQRKQPDPTKVVMLCDHRNGRGEPLFHIETIYDNPVGCCYGVRKSTKVKP